MNTMPGQQEKEIGDGLPVNDYLPPLPDPEYNVNCAASQQLQKTNKR